MPITEIYVKMIVGFDRDPKVRQLARFGEDAGLARALYLSMVLHCRENLTDGWVPVEEIPVLAHPLPPDRANQIANHLGSVGLTKKETKNEADGWQVLAYVKRNGTREDVERLSEVRKMAGSKGGRPPGKTPARRASKPNRNQKGNQAANQTESTDRVIDRVKEDLFADADAPAVSAVAANGGQPQLTDTQRSKVITDAYHDAVDGMCKWPAVNGIVLAAIRAGKFTDEAIRVALMRHVAANRPVTIDSLRTELTGWVPPSPRASPARRGGAADDLAGETYGQGRTRI